MTEETSSYGEEMGRRKFFTGIISVVAGMVAAVVGLPAIGYLVAPGLEKQSQEEWITLGPVSSLVPGVPTGYPYSQAVKDGWVESTKVGVAYAVTFDGQNVTVFSDVCTHLSCRVTWKADRGAFVCPCHDGIFSAAGAVLAGPPPRPLDQFESKVENGQIQIKLEA